MPAPSSASVEGSGTDFVPAAVATLSTRKFAPPLTPFEKMLTSVKPISEIAPKNLPKGREPNASNWVSVPSLSGTAAHKGRSARRW